MASQPDALPLPINNTSEQIAYSTKEPEQHELEQDPQKNALSRIATNSSQIQHSNARLVALVVTLTGAAFLNTLSVQSCVIILPAVGKALDIPSSRQQWIVSAYALTFGCFLLLWGRLGDVFGKRAIFIGGSVWVTIMCVAIPFAPSEIAFDVSRGLQGIGAAANVPVWINCLECLGDCVG